MAEDTTQTVEVFYSYAEKDERWCQRLEMALSTLKGQDMIVG